VSDNPVYNNADSDRIIALNEFSKAIDACRSDLTKAKVIEEHTYRYAIIRSYSKALIRTCEIYTLMKEGYPEGAFSLSRSLYEALIVIEKLLDGASINDSLLLQRFFDAVHIAQLIADIDILKDFPNDNSKSRVFQEYLKKDQATFRKYQSKYPKENLKSSYWWTGATTFRNLAGNSKLGKNPAYKFICDHVHFNAYSALNYLHQSDGSLLIGTTHEGLKFPLRHSTLYLYLIAEIIHAQFPDLISSDTIEVLENAVKTALFLLE